MSNDKTEQTSLALKEAEVIQPSEPSQATSLLGVIAQAARDPNVNIEKMERLLAMQQVIMEEQRRVAFAEALARLQAILPQVEKSGVIMNKDKVTERSRYAKIEDIDVTIRPLLAAEGFSFSFDTESAEGKIFKIFCKLTHRAGHSETKCLTLPLDVNEYRTNVQSVGSTVSYGKRHLIKMHLNLIERGEDDDAQGGSEPITLEQARTLVAFVEEVKADQKKFLSYMGVESIDKILSRDFQKAINALETKRKANANP